MGDGLAALGRHVDATQALKPMDNGAAIRATLADALDLARWRAIEAAQVQSG
jgi:hypothetical protein